MVGRLKWGTGSAKDLSEVTGQRVRQIDRQTKPVAYFQRVRLKQASSVVSELGSEGWV